MELLEKIVEFIANLTTATLGVVAIYALIFHKDKLTAFVRILTQTLINERIKRIKGTLGALEILNFDIKEQRKEIFALFGELAGMLKGFSKINTSYRECYEEVIKVVEKKKSLTEPRKRQLEQEIHGLLDDHTLEDAVILMEEDNGSKNNSSNAKDSK